MPLLYVAPGTQVDLQRAAPNTVIIQGPADQIEPLTPLGCLTQWRPPTFRPTLMPEPQTARPRAGDSFTDVSVALGVAFDAHQLDRVIFYNAPLLSQVQLELATAIDREECRNPKSSQHPFLAEWQLAAAHVDSAARGQELHYEEHQGAVVRLGLLQQCDMWTRRREHWIDKDAQRGTWGAAGYSVELRSDFASWSRPVSSRHVLTRQPRQRRTTAPLQSQPVESPFPLTPSDSSISGPSSETLPLVAADSIHRRLRPIALLELKRLLACPEVVMIVLHKLATGTSRIILNRGLESGSSSVNGFALERRPDLPLGFDLNVDQNVIVQIVQQHWRGVEHGEADFVVGSAPDGQYCRRVREKVVKACMQASLPSSHPSSVSSVSKPNPAPPPRTPCPWSALRVGLAYVCVLYGQMQSNRCGSIVLYNTQSAIMSEYTDVSRVKLSSRIPPAGQMSAEGDIVTIAMLLVWLSGVKITSVQQVPAPPTLGQKRPSTEDEDDDEGLDESGFWNAFQGSSTSVSNRDQARRGVGERQSGKAGSADTQAGPSLDQECQVSGEIIDEAIGQDGSPSEDQMTGRCGPADSIYLHRLDAILALRDFEFEPETLYAGLDATTSLTFTFGSGAASKDARVLACPSGRSTVHVDLLVPVDRGHLWEAFKGVLYIPHLPVNGNLRNPLGPIAHSRDADGKRSSVSDRPGDAVSPSGKRTRECESGRPSNDTALAPGGKLETKDGVTDDGAMSCAKLHHPASLDSFLSAPRKARSSLALPAPPGSSFEASLDVGAAGARKRLSSSLTQNSTTSSDSRTLVGPFDWISSKQAEALSPPPPAATRTPPSSTPPTVALPVVVKFAVVSPSQKPVHVHPSETELEQTLSAAEAVQAIRREVDLYMGALRDAGLVGHTTCGFHGVWRAETERGEEVWAMLLDELGPAVAAAWSELDPRWRPAIEALYRSLHDAGIVHGDLQVRHVRHIYPVHLIDLDASSKSSPDYSAANSPLRLIDFDSARMASASERAQEWQDLMINLDLASARLGLLSTPKSRRSDELE